MDHKDRASESTRLDHEKPRERDARMKNETKGEAKQLTAEDRRMLSESEAVVRSGLHAYVQAGNALARIQKNKWYEPQTWKAYLNDAFALAPPRALRLIAAAKCYNVLLANGCEMLPANENVAATLADKLQGEDDAKFVQFWAKAVKEAEGKPVTAAIIRKVNAENGGYQTAAEKRSPTTDKLQKLESLVGDLEKAKLSKADKTKLRKLYEKLAALLDSGKAVKLPMAA